MTNGRRLREGRKSAADAEAAESRRRRDTKRTSGLVQQVFKTKHTGTEGYNGDVTFALNDPWRCLRGSSKDWQRA